MKMIINRIKQLESQLNDPEILDKNRIEIKLETFKECLQMVLNEETVKRESLIDFAQWFKRYSVPYYDYEIPRIVEKYLNQLNE